MLKMIIEFDEEKIKKEGKYDLQKMYACLAERFTKKGLKVVENAEAMRIQLIFDGKPDADVRAVLKENGFRWAPSQNAWQRQLNGNGKAAASNVIQKLAAMQ